MRNLFLILVLSFMILGCQKAPDQNTIDDSPAPVTAYFDAIKRNFDNVEKVCYDYKSQLFFVKLSKLDEDQKKYWGWNVLQTSQFKELGNKTEVLISSSWINTQVDTIGLTCDQ